MKWFLVLFVFLHVPFIAFAEELPKPFYCIIYFTDKGFNSQSTNPLEYKIVVVEPWRKDNKGPVLYRLRNPESRKYEFVKSNRDAKTKTISVLGTPVGGRGISHQVEPNYFDTYNEAFEFCEKKNFKLNSSQHKSTEKKQDSKSIETKSPIPDKDKSN